METKKPCNPTPGILVLPLMAALMSSCMTTEPPPGPPARGGQEPARAAGPGGRASGHAGDAVLNCIGRDSVWIGRNRGGGQVSYEMDSIGQFPLGDTRLPGRGAADSYARLHDIEYWVGTHWPEGAQVGVPAPGGIDEYFTSEGRGELRYESRLRSMEVCPPD